MSRDMYVGKKLPSFKLKTSDDNYLTEGSLIGKLKVIYIYPKNDTSGCTRENLQYSEYIKEFKKLEITLFGLSKDSIESHKKFKKKHDIKIELISDPKIQLITDLGSWIKKSMYGKEYMGVERSTFFIDKNNIIKEVWRKVKVNEHVNNVLKSCKEILN